MLAGRKGTGLPKVHSFVGVINNAGALSRRIADAAAHLEPKARENLDLAHFGALIWPTSELTLLSTPVVCFSLLTVPWLSLFYRREAMETSDGRALIAVYRNYLAVSAEPDHPVVKHDAVDVCKHIMWH